MARNFGRRPVDQFNEQQTRAALLPSEESIDTILPPDLGLHPATKFFGRYGMTPHQGVAVLMHDTDMSGQQIEGFLRTQIYDGSSHDTLQGAVDDYLSALNIGSPEQQIQALVYQQQEDLKEDEVVPSDWISPVPIDNLTFVADHQGKFVGVVLNGHKGERYRGRVASEKHYWEHQATRALDQL